MEHKEQTASEGPINRTKYGKNNLNNEETPIAIRRGQSNSENITQDHTSEAPKGEVIEEIATHIRQNASKKSSMGEGKQPSRVMGSKNNAHLKKTDALSDKEREKQVESLIKNAKRAKNNFKKLINDAAGIKGAKNGDPGFKHVIKSMKSSRSKAKNRMKGKSVSDMKDALRGIIICENQDAIEAVREFLKTHVEKAFQENRPEIVKKDGFVKDENQSAGGLVGYGDIKFIVPIRYGKDKDGFWMYAEIEVMTEGMHHVKENGGHHFYEILRAMKEENGTFKLTPNRSLKKAAREILARDEKTLKQPKQTPGKLKDPKSLKDLGMTGETLSSFKGKLAQLRKGKEVTLTKKEYDLFLEATRLIYRMERLEGNLQAIVNRNQQN